MSQLIIAGNFNGLLKKVFENENFLVINKEAGISTQRNNSYEESIEEVLKTLNESFSLLPRCGIVHRLDKDTTGLLLIAKNLEYFHFFTNLFKERKINKIYLSLHRGKPRTASGTVTFLIKKSFENGKQVRMKFNHSDGKLVELDFRLVEHKNDFSLLEVNPLTGRTHQIRVAFQLMKIPIYNDQLYSNEKPEKENGHYLHAFRLDFVDRKGQRFSFKAELPFFFREKLKLLEIFDQF